MSCASLFPFTPNSMPLESSLRSTSKRIFKMPNSLSAMKSQPNYEASSMISWRSLKRWRNAKN